MTSRLWAGFLILVVNSGYLAVFAEASLFYVANVLLHLVLGVLLSILAIPTAKRFFLRQPPQNVAWMVAGVAFAENGAARGAMGIDAVDYDSSGAPSLIIGNFSNEMVSLYHNEGRGFFIDMAPVSEVGRKSLLTLAFAAFFFDFNLDGHQDIFITNGHVENDIQTVQQRVAYEQPPHLFHNVGDGRFAEVTDRVGPDLARPVVGRGAAYGDIDGDGDLDLVVTTNGGPAYLYRNDGGDESAWIAFRLSGTESNREGIGARIRVTAGGHTQSLVVKSATGYCSQNQLPVTFGLGKATGVDKVEVVWPNGKTQSLGALDLRKIHNVTES